MTNSIFQDKELLGKLQGLTVARLKTMPENTRVAIGSQQHSKSDLLGHVSKADELGKQIMIMQLEYLQALASGEIYKDDHTDHPAQA